MNGSGIGIDPAKGDLIGVPTSLDAFSSQPLQLVLKAFDGRGGKVQAMVSLYVSRNRYIF